MALLCLNVEPGSFVKGSAQVFVLVVRLCRRCNFLCSEAWFIKGLLTSILLHLLWSNLLESPFWRFLHFSEALYQPFPLPEGNQNIKRKSVHRDQCETGRLVVLAPGPHIKPGCFGCRLCDSGMMWVTMVLMQRISFFCALLFTKRCLGP